MLGLIQRVSEASVSVEDEVVGRIGKGLLLLLGVQKDDTEKSVEKLLDRVIAYRVFPDDGGNMNLNLREAGGDLLIVSQFTLAADTKKGLRPSFSSAAEPAVAQNLYNLFVELAGSRLERVQSGVFGANMQVSLTNDGPVTFLLDR